jgi:hypothetical protein
MMMANAKRALSHALVDGRAAMLKFGSNIIGKLACSERLLLSR